MKHVETIWNYVTWEWCLPLGFQSAMQSDAFWSYISIILMVQIPDLLDVYMDSTVRLFYSFLMNWMQFFWSTLFALFSTIMPWCLFWDVWCAIQSDVVWDTHSGLWHRASDLQTLAIHCLWDCHSSLLADRLCIQSCTGPNQDVDHRRLAGRFVRTSIALWWFG